MELCGMGDTATDLVASGNDVESLAHRIVEDLLRAGFFLMLQVSLPEIDRKDYIFPRLIRLLDYSLELAVGIDGAREEQFAILWLPCNPLF